jgi:hypothetical protein
MEKILFFKATIEKYTEGGFLKKLFSWLAKAIAIAAVCYGLYRFVDQWAGMGEGMEAVLSRIVYQALWLLLVYVVLHIWWMKGIKLSGLKDTDYILIPTAVHYARGFGETCASYSIILSVAHAFLALLTNSTYNLVPNIPMVIQISTESSFLWSIILVANGVLVGIVMLGVYYLVAEILLVWLEIARNTRKK